MDVKESSEGRYYGWYIVSAASLITLLTVGFRLGVGPFVKPVMMDLGSVLQPEITWRDAINTRAYWQIVIGLFACGFSMNLLGSQAVPMLIDHHFDPMTASFGVGIIGIVAIFSTLLLGSIADRYSRKNILFWIYFVRGLGFLGLVSAVTPWQLYLVAATGGLVWAGSTAMASAILSDLFGVKLLGLLYGWAYFGHQIGGAIGSFLGGWGYETLGTHFFAFGLTTVILLIASGISYLLPEQMTILHPSEVITSNWQ